ncbi:MAG: hypothetical protein HY665_08155 [Chloroflexi bacterium]|nr:hypothetical protein [Chloroflexota bacterium]
MSPVEFHPGDVVSHPTFGVGRIISIESGESPSLVISFPNMPPHPMSLRVATSSLTIRSPEGFEALSVNSPTLLNKWADEAPFKLVGCVLVDIGKPAKPGEIRERIESRQLLKTPWEQWWKKVQQAIKGSSFFKVSKGTYGLAVPFAQIPEAPLPAAAPKSKKRPIDAATAKDIARKVLSGEAQLSGGAEVLKPVLKELLRKDTPPQAAHEAFLKVAEGNAKEIRIVTDALIRAKKPGEVIAILEKLVESVRAQYLASQSDIPEADRERTLSRLGQLEESLKRLFAATGSGSLELAPLSDSAIRLAVDIWQENPSKWRADMVGRLVGAAAAVSGIRADNRYAIWCAIAVSQARVAAKVDVAQQLVSRLRAKATLDEEVLRVAAEYSPEFAVEYFGRRVSQPDQPHWIISFLKRALPGQTVESMTKIAKRNREVHCDETLLETAELMAIMAAAGSLMGKVSLDLTPKEFVKSLIDAIGPENRQPPPADLFQTSMREFLDRILEEERSQSKQQQSKLESEIQALKEQSQKSDLRVGRQEDEIRRLQSGYRVPEKWAAYSGKKEIIEDLARFYQEVSISKDPTLDAATRAWLLTRLEIILQRKGVTRLGQAGAVQKFDPASHEFIAGTKEISDTVTIVCPGFQWEDPNGNRVILLRSIVSR